jgi:Integrase core domain
MAESAIGLYKTELIRRRTPWRNPDQVATLEYIDWFNNRRLHGQSATCRRRSSRRCSTPRRPRRESKAEGLYRTQGASLVQEFVALRPQSQEVLTRVRSRSYSSPIRRSR